MQYALEQIAKNATKRFKQEIDLTKAEKIYFRATKQVNADIKKKKKK